jgi:hypothetical protein
MERIIMSKKIVYGKVMSEVYCIKNISGDIYQVELINGESKITLNFSNPAFSKLLYKPEIYDIDCSFSHFEKLYETENNIDISKGETLFIVELNVKTKIEDVVKSTNGDIEYYSDYIIVTNVNYDNRNEADKLLKEEMEKYNKIQGELIGPNRKWYQF